MLRYIFAFFIAFLSICIFCFFCYYKSLKSFIDHSIAKSTSGITQSFKNSVLDKHYFVFEIHDYNPEMYETTQQFLNFKIDTENFFSGLDIAQAEVFLHDGQNIFSLKKYFGHQHHASYYNFNGKSCVHFFDNNNNLVVKTPILNSEELVGIVELTYNINQFLNNLRLFWFIFCLFCTLVFTVFFLWIFFKLIKGSKMLNQQFEINNKLKLAKANVESASLQKSQFFANVSHELKTPLNAIIGFSDLIQKSRDTSETHKGYAKDIYNSGNHLLNLINDILDFSKSELNKLKIKFNLFNLNKLIDICVRMTIANTENIEIKKSFFDDQIIIKSDHKRMKQVLLNVLSNSVKFTDNNGVINIGVKLIKDYIEIKIADNGIGIAEKDLPKALSAFGQSSSSLSRKYDGTGIGLPFSKNLVELMGGKFFIESKERMGTTVRILLPHKKTQA